LKKNLAKKDTLCIKWSLKVPSLDLFWFKSKIWPNDKRSHDNYEIYFKSWYRIQCNILLYQYIIIIFTYYTTICCTGYCAREAEGNRKMCTVDEVCCTGPRDAHTRLVVLERGVFMSYPATKVLLQLITGRRHQIRVHCSTIGHTIVGDYTYSGRKDTSPSRTFLHSYRWVWFEHQPEPKLLCPSVT